MVGEGNFRLGCEAWRSDEFSGSAGVRSSGTWRRAELLDASSHLPSIPSQNR